MDSKTALLCVIIIFVLSMQGDVKGQKRKRREVGKT